MKNTVAEKVKQVPEGYLVVGVDPHKRKHAAIAMTQDFATRDKFKFANTRDGLEAMLERMRDQMLKSGCRGVMFATATVSHLEDYVRKLEKAKQVKDGLVYIHIFSPCWTGWRADENGSVEVSRMAVETNYFPLWECERGEYRLNYTPHRQLPIHEFTRLMGRFDHLKEDDLKAFQEMVDERFGLIEAHTRLKKRA